MPKACVPSKRPGHEAQLSISRGQNSTGLVRPALATGRMMPEDGIEQLRPFDAVYLGAVGFPAYRTTNRFGDLLIPIRREFDQHINLRPVRLFRWGPCRSRAASRDIDFDDRARETWKASTRRSAHSERRHGRGSRHAAVSSSRVTSCRPGSQSTHRARQSRRCQTPDVATKSNGIIHSMPYWDTRVAEMAKEVPG